MADDPLNVQHRIRLEYEEQIRSSISQHLESLRRQLAQIEKSFKSHHKGIGAVGSATKGAVGTYKAFGKAAGGAAAKMGGMSKMAFRLGKSLGVVGLYATAAFQGLKVLGGAALTIIELGGAMVDFAAKSGVGASAVITLREAYWEMTDASGAASISLRDLTESMTKFASIGFPQQMLAAEKGMQTAVLSMQEGLTQALGDPRAADALTQSLFQATSGELPIMREFRDAINATGGDINKLAAVVRSVQFSQLDDSAFREAAGALDILYEKSQGGVDGAVSAFTSWRDIVNKFTAAVSNIGQVVLETFGGDIAKIIDGAKVMFTNLISNMSGWGAKLKEFWVIAKTIGHNYVEVWKMAWNAVSGLAQIAVGGWSIAIGSFLSWLPGELGKAFEKMQKWGQEVGKAGEEALRAAGDPKFLYIQEELEKHYREQNRLLREQKKSVGDIVKANDPLVAKLRELRDEIQGRILPSIESWTKSLESAALVTASLADLTALVGFRYGVMGDQIGNITRDAAQTQMAVAKALLDSAGDDALARAQEYVGLLEKQVALGETNAGTMRALAEGQKQVSVIIAARAEAFGKLRTLQEQYVSDVRADLTLTEKARQVAQARLAVTQAIYGTPALAVKAQLAVVKTMEQEKQLIEAMIVGQQQLLQDMAAQGIEGSKLQFVQERLLDLQKEHTEKTREQLELVKSLRDGYLDAVQAQAFGAGRFSKILITQEKNLMRGLQKGVAKRNYLLGQFGEAAGAAQAEAFRFSAQGMGQIESMQGKLLTADDVARQQEARIAGIDKSQSGPAREANQIMMGIVSAADQNHLKLVDTYVKQTGRVVGAIDRMATTLSMRSVRAAGLQGRPGDTALGEAVRGVGEGRAEPGPGAGFPLGPETDRNTEALQKQREQLEEQIKQTEELIKTLKEQKVPEVEVKVELEKLAKLKGEANKIRSFDREQYVFQTNQQGASEAGQTAMLKFQAQESKMMEQAAATDRKRLTEDVDPMIPDPTIPEKPEGVLSNLDVGAANTFYGSALGYYKTFVDLLGKIAKEKKIIVRGGEGDDGAPGDPGVAGTTPAPAPLDAMHLHQDGKTADRATIRNLRKTDREVKQHERAHQVTAGPFAIGSPEYTYEEGPDGKRYAVGGQVLVDISPIPGDPEGTIEKMERVRKAALAPLNPSEQDEKVAATAVTIEDKMRESLLSQRVVRYKRVKSKKPKKKEGETLEFPGFRVKAGRPDIKEPETLELHQPEVIEPDDPKIKDPKVLELHQPKIIEPDDPEIKDPKILELHQPKIIEPDDPEIKDPKILELHQSKVIEPDDPEIKDPKILELYQPNIKEIDPDQPKREDKDVLAFRKVRIKIEEDKAPDIRPEKEILEIVSSPQISFSTPEIDQEEGVLEIRGRKLKTSRIDEKEEILEIKRKQLRKPPLKPVKPSISDDAFIDKALLRAIEKLTKEIDGLGRSLGGERAEIEIIAAGGIDELNKAISQGKKVKSADPVIKKATDEVSITIREAIEDSVGDPELIKILRNIDQGIKQLHEAPEVQSGVAPPAAVAVADQPSLAEAEPGVADGTSDIALAGVAAGGTVVAANQAIKMATATAKAPLKVLKSVTQTITKVAKYNVTKPLNAVGRGAQIAGRRAQSVVSGLRGAQAITPYSVAPVSSAPYSATPKSPTLARQSGQATAKLAARGAQAVAPHLATAKTILGTKIASGAGSSFLPAATTAGLIGTGAAAGAAAGGIYTLGKSIETASQEKVAMSATNRSMEEDALFWVSAANKESDDIIAQLRGKRQEIDAMLLTNVAAGVEVKGFFAAISRGLGFMADIPELGKKEAEQIEKLRDQRQAIQDEITARVGTEGAEGDEGRNLMRPYVEEFEGNLQEMAGISLKIGDVGPEVEEKLQARIDELQSEISLGADTVRMKFGDLGTSAVTNALDRFAENLTTQAGNQIIAYGKDIEDLRVLKGTDVVAPEYLGIIDAKIIKLQTNINDLLADFGQESIAAATPEINAVIEREEVQADLAGIKSAIKAALDTDLGQSITSAVSNVVAVLTAKTTESAAEQVEGPVIADQNQTEIDQIKDSIAVPAKPVNKRITRLQKTQEVLKKARVEREDKLDAYFYKMGLEGEELGQKLREASGLREKKREPRLPDPKDMADVLHAPELPDEGILTAIDTPDPIPDQSIEDILMREFKDLPEHERTARSNYVRSQLDQEKQISTKLDRAKAKLEKAQGVEEPTISDDVKAHASMMGYRRDEEGKFKEDRVTTKHGFGIPDLADLLDPADLAAKKAKRKAARRKLKDPVMTPEVEIPFAGPVMTPEVEIPSPGEPGGPAGPPVPFASEPPVPAAGPLAIPEPKMPDTLTHGNEGRQIDLSGGVGAGRGATTMGKGGGNMASKMRIVTQILMEMASEIDKLNEEQNNITQYGSGRIGSGGPNPAAF